MELRPQYKINTVKIKREKKNLKLKSQSSKAAPFRAAFFFLMRVAAKENGERPPHEHRIEKPQS